MRYRKGTLDHDNDGRKGGSLKGDAGMVKVKGTTASEKKVVAAAKRSARTPARAPAKPASASKAPSAAQVAAADLEASVGRHPGGMEPPMSEDAKKAALEAQFAAADAVGDPRRDEQAAILGVRGF